MTTRPERLRQLLGLIDLTSLNDAMDDDIATLCAKAQTPHGSVAAVCSWPRFARDISVALKGTGIATAVVINFPSGDESSGSARAEAQRAITDGAGELDLVWPYKAWQRGDRELAMAMVQDVKQVCHGAKLKVILESGAFDFLDDLAQASRDAITAGADVLKTSTGKIPKGATPEAARVLLREIKNAGGSVGFKASGGIRSIADAESYLSLAEDLMGPNWPSVQTFRIGASRLLDEILDALG